MGIKASFSKIYAEIIASKITKWRENAPKIQEKVFHSLISTAKGTVFGQDHYFSEIVTYEDFKKHVPIYDYEDLRPYIDKIIAGESDVLWPGKPEYLAKTSGTTSGLKYIPLTKASLKEQINGARNSLLNYIDETGKTDFVDGKMIFLQGSPELSSENGISFGRLSGIVAHHIPLYLQKNRLPSFKTNCIEDWETKVEEIVEETIHQDMRLISGIPPWVQMYFDRLSAKAEGKKVKDIFKNFSLFVYGGVNFEPYRAKLQESIGKKVDSIETYPASEGFIAFQNSQEGRGLLLLPDSGIFYEFIPTDEYFNDQPTRVSLRDVELGVNYALILNTNAGLWGYSIGDTVKFISKNPYLIIVTGRIKHFISAFGEHVIAEEVEESLLHVANKEGIEIVEFTVAPQVHTEEGELPYHEWFIEFVKVPDDILSFSRKVDLALQQKNAYYFDLIEGKVLQPLIIRPMKKEAFINYMRSTGKLGGQNKLPRLSNDRKIADQLDSYIL